VNYLAHAVLAEPHGYSLIGNVAGDLIKGRLQEHRLHPRVADGVRRHRRVDVLTDASTELQDLKRVFPAGARRYAGIVLDVLFDHYLCRDWPCFYTFDRGEFTEAVYRTLRDGGASLPAPLAEVAPRWVDARWLEVYETLDGVEAVLDRLSLRLGQRRCKRNAQRRAAPRLGALLAIAETHEARLRRGFRQVFHEVRTRLDGVRPLEPEQWETGHPTLQQGAGPYGSHR
jgi:acyl carrier protein phosphodiesterase